MPDRICTKCNRLQKICVCRTMFQQDQSVWWCPPPGNRRLWGKVAVAKLRRCWMAFPLGGSYLYRWCRVEERMGVTHSNTFRS
jgi:hypothetical protein